MKFEIKNIEKFYRKYLTVVVSGLIAVTIFGGVYIYRINKTVQALNVGDLPMVTFSDGKQLPAFGVIIDMITKLQTDVNDLEQDVDDEK